VKFIFCAFWQKAACSILYASRHQFGLDHGDTFEDYTFSKRVKEIDEFTIEMGIMSPYFKPTFSEKFIPRFKNF
jgi:hypothetical protein